MSVVVELHHILYWLARTYTQGDLSALPQQFDETLLPPPALDIVRRSVAQLKKQQADLRARDETLLKQQRETEALRAQLAALQRQIATQKAVNQAIPDTHDYSEAETRRRIIDVMLREAGWDPAGPNVPEYQVTGMPFGSGTGYVDYVLWGDDGLPLALVEAKRTSVDPNQGKQQAKLYADCLQAMHGRRPIIFYTNGYTTYLWDDQRYPARQVQGFYTKDQLMLLIQWRTIAHPLAGMVINQAIVNRYYQDEAIRRMTAHFSADHRKGLLVMATGSGKTRVAIALVDLLMRAGWVKHVLFLADRSALVRQATGAFKSHLPAGNPVNPEDLTALESFFYQAEAVGGQAQFVQIYGQQENLAAFIRSLVGLDRAKAKERFAQFLDGQTYTADQIRFVNYIIDHLTANGTIAPELLYGQPYTDIHYQGLTGVFPDSQAKALLNVVQTVNVVVG